jgi:cation:H+ antiporter
MSPALLLLLGVVLAGAGGELFVRGTVGLASAARVSPGIIAATVAAFATSSPELTVSVTSAWAGRPGIALGDALGSNVVNVALILGVALLLAPITVPQGSTRRDIPIALGLPVLTALLLADGVLSRIEGLFLLAAFMLWLTAIVVEATRERSAVSEVLGEARLTRAIIESLVGLALLIGAGKAIVSGGTDLAKQLGWSEFVIGATVVALGTSVPELATAVISRLRGHDEVGLGTVLGSNIFNNLFIVGVAATITPIAVPLTSAAVPLVVGFAVVAMAFPPRSGRLDRWRGGMLVVTYCAYVLTTLQMG